MRMKSVLYPVLASFVVASALYVPARAAGLNIETATIADLNAAFASGPHSPLAALLVKSQSDVRVKVPRKSILPRP